MMNEKQIDFYQIQLNIMSLNLTSVKQSINEARNIKASLDWDSDESLAKHAKIAQLIYRIDALENIFKDMDAYLGRKNEIVCNHINNIYDILEELGE